jgi:16S rRNA C967 or C1407 C5-methylase (RsmB/RsmF family)
MRLHEPVLSRYRDLVDDFDAFVEAAQAPLPTCVWANTLRITPAALAARLAARGVEARPSRFFEGAFLLAPEISPGHSVEYVTGLFHVQEEIALAAVEALSPLPHERVLDLCASPGNKTARMGLRMGDTGLILANELRQDRLPAMRFNLERLGLTNVLVRHGDGANVPPEAGPFDRVMADVPCTCEGTSRRGPGALKPVPDDVRLKMSRVQGHLLRRALKLTRPGGRLVYATCTYAPEENELVLDEVLRHHGQIIPFEINSLRGDAAQTRWQGRALRPDLAHARRYLPHHNDTGGFFVALIEVTQP